MLRGGRRRKEGWGRKGKGWRGRGRVYAEYKEDDGGRRISGLVSLSDSFFRSAPVSRDVTEAVDPLQCVVCLSDPVDPHLCKQCAHFICNLCLTETYRTGPAACPHCRGRFPLTAFVRVPWAAEQAKLIRGFAPTIADECPNHPRKHLIVHCYDCHCSACATCWR